MARHNPSSKQELLNEIAALMECLPDTLIEALIIEWKQTAQANGWLIEADQPDSAHQQQQPESET